MKKGFDNDKYLQMQSEHIRERIAQFDNKLYLEFGGKLFDDYHASRVLPGFQPDSKLQMLLQLKDQAEVVIVINAEDIVSSKVRGDYGITYDLDVLRLIDAFQERGLFVGSVCVTMYTAAPEVEAFEKRLNSLGIRTFRHYKIPGYPNDVARIVSDEGYGRNEYIETQRPLVVITAPGPGSGKMATCQRWSTLWWAGCSARCSCPRPLRRHIRYGDPLPLSGRVSAACCTASWKLRCWMHSASPPPSCGAITAPQVR